MGGEIISSSSVASGDCPVIVHESGQRSGVVD